MPLFSDHITNMYYSGSPSYTSSPYSYSSAVSPYGTSYSASYLNSGGNYSSHSSLGGFSRTPVSSRWLTSSGRTYSPMLSTISEKGTSSPIRINSPRRNPISNRNYISSPYTSRPININTADIDVSRDKYRNKVPSSNTVIPSTLPPRRKSPLINTETGHDKPDTGIDSSPGRQRTTIKRDRTVVRLHTVKRKERDSPRKPIEVSEVNEIKPDLSKKIEGDTKQTESLKWREKLADDLTYKVQKEKKSLGAKLVEKFTLKDKVIDEYDNNVKQSPTNIIIKEKSPVVSIESKECPPNKSVARRCSMELLAEQASLLDSLIRRENLSIAPLDLSKIGTDNSSNTENIKLESVKKRKLSGQENRLSTTKSDHSLHDRVSSQNLKDLKFIKRKSLRKCSSGSSISKLDCITEMPKNTMTINSSSLEVDVIEKSVENPKPKPKTKITSTVEITTSSPQLKFIVENVTVEEKLRPCKKDIIFSSTVDEQPCKEIKSEIIENQRVDIKSKKKLKPQQNINKIQSNSKKIKRDVKKGDKLPTGVTISLSKEHRKSLSRHKPLEAVDNLISPEPEDGNFWDKIGKRETVYLMKRKENLAKVNQENKRLLCWFPEDDGSSNKNSQSKKLSDTKSELKNIDIKQTIAAQQNEPNTKESQDLTDTLEFQIQKLGNETATTDEKLHQNDMKSENNFKSNCEIIKNVSYIQDKNCNASEIAEDLNEIETKKIPNEQSNNDTFNFDKSEHITLKPEMVNADKLSNDIIINTIIDRKCKITEGETENLVHQTSTSKKIIDKAEKKALSKKGIEEKSCLIDVNKSDSQTSLQSKNKTAINFAQSDEKNLSASQNDCSTTPMDKNKIEPTMKNNVTLSIAKEKLNSAVEIKNKSDNINDEKNINEVVSIPRNKVKVKELTSNKKIEAIPNEEVNDINIKKQEIADIESKDKESNQLKEQDCSESSKTQSSISSQAEKHEKILGTEKAVEILDVKAKIQDELVSSSSELSCLESAKQPSGSVMNKEINIDTKVVETVDVKDEHKDISESASLLTDMSENPVILDEPLKNQTEIESEKNTENVAAANTADSNIKKKGLLPTADGFTTFVNKNPVKEQKALKPLIATPRPLQKRNPQVIRSSSSSESSDEDSSDTEEEEEEDDESGSSRASTEFFECENNLDGRTSTGSNDSGFDSSAPTSPSGFLHAKKDCDVNCHRKCEKLTANLCGVNQRLLVEALASRTISKRGGDNPSTSTGTAPPQSFTHDILEQELEHSTAYDLFRKTGRFTPPARTIPRFRKYTIEDFQFIRVLGKGSFGKVMLAELRDTEYYYAVKCLKKDVVLEDDDVECTLIERKVLALGTNHPYLCHLFATFQTDSHLFFVMEYLNGGDLMFHIQQSGRFPEARARFYAAEIVSGLKFLHKRGIVYRDLKLDNILLDFDGHVRIADFGMCKLQIYLDKTADTFCGTPDYMAPEIIKGLKYNQTVDWWSFGVLLYEMLIGQSPFSGCDEDELFWSICNEMPSYPRFLSHESLSILTRLLDKDAKTRLGSPECMHGDIRDQDFFRTILWDRLERRELETPFKPRVRHPMDTQYFDRAFTGERPRLTAVEPQVLRSMDQEPFRGFSYTNPNATDR